MIAIITEQQKGLLVNNTFDGVQYFNPIQDIDNNWVISEEEIIQCTIENFQWVKSLQLSQYNPKPSNNF